MVKFKNIGIFLLLFICLFQKSKAQLCWSIFAQSGYSCITNQAFTSYTLGGGVGPWSYTVVDVANSATVITGILSTSMGTFAPLPQGNYNIYGASSSGCTGSTSCMMNITYGYANPVVTSASITCFGANNGSASVTPPISFNANPSYTWDPGLVFTSTIGNLLPGITYTVTIKDNKGCKTETTVTVLEPPPIFSTLASTFINCFGQSLNTLVTSTGNVGATSYYINGAPILGNNAINIMAGVQTIVTVDSKGCSKTNTVLVDQRIPPTITFNKFSPTCPKGSNGSISPAISNATPVYLYTWTPGNINTSNLTNIPAGTYTFVLRDGNGCTTTSITTVAQAVSATVIPISTPEDCSAVDAAFTVNVNGVLPPFNYTILPMGTSLASNTLAGLSSGDYTILTSYNTTCVDTTEFIIGNLSTVSVSIQSSVPVLCYSSCNASLTLNIVNAILPVTYSATGTQTTNLNSFANLCAGFYTIRAVDANGCPATTTISLNTPPQFTYTATAPTSVCAGQAVNLQASASGGTGGYTFVWKPGNTMGQVVNLIPAGTTVYSLNAYDANGCTQAAKELTVTVAPQLSISINSTGAGICPGTTAQITPTVSGGDGAYTYSWMPGNTTGSSIFVENITVPVYTITVKDGCGSPTVTKPIRINLFPATKPEFFSKRVKGCEPMCTQFINLTPKSYNVIWNYGDKPVEKRGDTTNYCYLKSGKYSLTLSLTDSNACRTWFTYTNAVTVMKSPSSEFTTTPQYLTIGTSDNVLVKNLTEDAVKYEWYMAEDYLGSSKDIYTRFADTGCYKMRLISENDFGCRDTLTKNVYVFEDYNFYMPNSFTPNNDGDNDVYVPKGTGWLSDNYSFEVFDRWGRRMFTTGDLKGTWDGTNADKDIPFGTYVWKVLITDLRGKVHKHAGTVTVIW